MDNYNTFIIPMPTEIANVRNKLYSINAVYANKALEEILFQLVENLCDDFLVYSVDLKRLPKWNLLHKNYYEAPYDILDELISSIRTAGIELWFSIHYLGLFQPVAIFVPRVLGPHHLVISIYDETQQIL